jgi:hypothetical protein
MKIKNILTLPALVAVLAAAGSYSSLANPVVLTFEGSGDLNPIGNFYNGGGGGNLGISFGPDSLSLVSKYDGGSGNFQPQYMPSPDTCAFFLTGNGDVMDVAAGFTTGFSFFYSAPFYTGSVSVYSGLDGTGTLLGTLNLGLTNPNIGQEYYNGWNPAGVSFAGTAMSAIFSGTANYIIFDDITLGSQNPGNGVPDGGVSAALLGMGLMGLVVYSRRLAVAK